MNLGYFFQKQKAPQKAVQIDMHFTLHLVVNSRCTIGTEHVKKKAVPFIILLTQQIAGFSLMLPAVAAWMPHRSSEYSLHRSLQTHCQGQQPLAPA